ncbi:MULTISPECIES: SH3 domain-containing protein [Sinorhizobium]|uniref:SH3 domain-containing protein n=1 Tax=Sinorhizobium TaxID=28105 RepID=UPI0015CF3195|nr:MULTISPECIES: SH3 domain-containing protein [Sinorhizobium]
MVDIVGPPSNATRCRPIADNLRELLDLAAQATGIDKIVITSGGQPSNHAPHLEDVPCGWTGSPRHDNGRAADLQLIKNGTTLRFTNSDGDQVAPFITACAARGANGIGAATDYMGPKTIHVGFGRTTSDTQKLVWGKDGLSANAPQWLRTAARQGWNNPADDFLTSAALALSADAPPASRSTVNARDGLWLRRGPGLAFDRARLLEAGTSLTIQGLDGEWARVDLQGDGLIDGYVFASFLGTSTMDHPDEGVEEPIDEAAIEKLLDGAADGAPAAPANAPRRAARRKKD